MAQEINAALVIIDERLARRHAARIGLTLTGTLGVLLRAKDLGHVKAIKQLLEELQRGGIWLSEEIIAETLKLAHEV